MMVIVFDSVTGVFIALAALAHKKRVNMSALGIGIDFLQIISIFTSFDFQWPVSLKKLFAIASATTYNDQLVAPECSVKTWTFELKWWMVQALPLVFVAVLVALLLTRGIWVRQGPISYVSIGIVSDRGVTGNALRDAMS